MLPRPSPEAKRKTILATLSTYNPDSNPPFILPELIKELTIEEFANCLGISITLLDNISSEIFSDKRGGYQRFQEYINNEKACKSSSQTLYYLFRLALTRLDAVYFEKVNIQPLNVSSLEKISTIRNLQEISPYEQAIDDFKTCKSSKEMGNIILSQIYGDVETDTPKDKKSKIKEWILHDVHRAIVFFKHFVSIQEASAGDKKSFLMQLGLCENLDLRKCKNKPSEVLDSILDALKKIFPEDEQKLTERKREAINYINALRENEERQLAKKLEESNLQKEKEREKQKLKLQENHQRKEEKRFIRTLRNEEKKMKLRELEEKKQIGCFGEILQLPNKEQQQKNKKIIEKNLLEKEKIFIELESKLHYLLETIASYGSKKSYANLRSLCSDRKEAARVFGIPPEVLDVVLDPIELKYCFNEIDDKQFYQEFYEGFKKMSLHYFKSLISSSQITEVAQPPEKMDTSPVIIMPKEKAPSSIVISSTLCGGAALSAKEKKRKHGQAENNPIPKKTTCV